VTSGQWPDPTGETSMLTPVPAEVDGEPVDAERAVALSSLSYGHFTAMVVDDLRVQGLQLHLGRLVRDCAVVFGAALDPDRVRGLLHRVAVRCDRPTMLRATLFDSAGSVARPGSGVGPNTQPSVLISTRPVTPAVPSTGLRVRTVNYVRQLPAVKHLGTFGQLHQRRLAQLAGFDDALFCTSPEPTARICEGPTWNVALLIGDELIWPNDSCLPGITRDLLRPVLDRADIGWSSRSVTRAELAQARAAFASSTGVGVVPIAELDGVTLPGEPDLLADLQAGYAKLPGELLGPVPTNR
jgi:branched-subunit amino acid aminotransferase/4-amino-4-deoxychorismate lyase